MIQPGRGTRFTQDSLAQHFTLAVAEPGGRKDLLDRDPAAQQFILSQPYVPHSAAAEMLNETVTPGDDPAGTRRHAHRGPLPGPREPNLAPRATVSRP
jgi:hypothetical protein